MTAPTQNGPAEPVSGSSRELVSTIEDPIVRRMVRLSVHVRGYAPYYLVTVILLGVLAFGPRPVSKPDELIGSNQRGAPGLGGAAGGTAAGRAAAAAGPSDSATAISVPADASLLSGGAIAADLGAGALDATALDGNVTDLAPAVPEAPAPDTGFSDVPTDFDHGSDVPEFCTMRLPSPAPAVTPHREVDGLQRTAEAAAGVQAPADPAPYVEDGIDTVGCPDTSAIPEPPPAPIGLPI